MSTPQTPDAPTTSPAGAPGQTSSPAVSAEDAGPAGLGTGRTWPPPPMPRCICTHLYGVHDIAKDGKTRTKCLTGLPPKGLPCPCVRYEPREVGHGDA